jgi:capsular exopolysaccharide synthesis family protein
MTEEKPEACPPQAGELPARLADAGAVAQVPRPAGGAVATFERLEPTASPLQEYLSLMLRRRRTLVIALAVIFGASLLGTATMPRLYEATATILVSQPSTGSQLDSLENQMPSVMAAAAAPTLDTHVELIQGQPVAAETAKWLKSHGGPALSPSAVRRSLRVKAVPKTQLVRVGALGRSPAAAEKIANAAAQCYVAMNRRRAQSSAESASRYLTEQLAMARQNVAEAEQALRIFNESTGHVVVDDAVPNLLQRVSMLQQDADTTDADLAQARQNLDRVRSQLDRQNRDLAAGRVVDNETLRGLRARLVDLEGKRLEAKSRYTEAFAAPVEDLDEQIAAVKTQLDVEIRNAVRAGANLDMHHILTESLIRGEAQVAALGSRARALQAGLRQADGALRKVPARQIAAARLQRQVEVAQNVYWDLLKRSQEIEVGRVMALGNTDIAEPASSPRLPVTPNVPLNLTFGLVLGLAVGIGLAVLQEQLDNTVRDQEEVARLVDAPILGTVPLFEAGKAVPISEHSTRGRTMEAYRALRYSLGFVVPGEGGRVVLVTSSNPLEGKTTTALNLATAAAASGRRAILVDSDLRRPSVHRVLNLNGRNGVTDVLVGQTALSEALQQLDGSHLRVLTAGTRAPNPADLLDSGAMRSLVEDLRQQADLVILDSPPLLSVADSLVLASLSDAILLVCVPGTSHRRDLQRSRLLLTQIGRTVSGVVLNKVERRAGYGYYGRYHYYHYYDYGGGEEKDALEAGADPGDGVPRRARRK